MQSRPPVPMYVHAPHTCKVLPQPVFCRYNKISEAGKSGHVVVICSGAARVSNCMQPDSTSVLTQGCFLLALL